MDPTLLCSELATPVLQLRACCKVVGSSRSCVQLPTPLLVWLDEHSLISRRRSTPLVELMHSCGQPQVCVVSLVVGTWRGWGPLRMLPILPEVPSQERATCAMGSW